MTRNQGLPDWLVALLAVVGLIVLGPPVLGFLLGVLGLAVGLIAVTAKFALIGLVVFGVVVLLRTLFGRSPRPSSV